MNIHSITPRSTSLTPRNIQERNLHFYKRSIASTNKQEHLSTITDAKWTFKRAQLTISNTKRKSLIEKETFNKTISIERHNQWRQETIIHCKVTFHPAIRTIIGMMSMFNSNKKVFISEFTTSCPEITNNGQ